MTRPQRHYRAIIEADWPAIMRIQAEVYHEFDPESEAVMRSKASHSLTTSFVAIDVANAEVTDNMITGCTERVVAYCLAHPYPSRRVAVLGTAYSASTADSDNLYLHDLAVERASSGRGIAQTLLHHVTAVAKSSGYRTMSLVAVQDAEGFWLKMGFTPSSNVCVDESYAAAATFMTREL